MCSWGRTYRGTGATPSCSSHERSPCPHQESCTGARWSGGMRPSPVWRGLRTSFGCPTRRTLPQQTLCGFRVRTRPRMAEPRQRPALEQRHPPPRPPDRPTPRLPRALPTATTRGTVAAAVAHGRGGPRETHLLQCRGPAVVPNGERHDALGEGKCHGCERAGEGLPSTPPEASAHVPVHTAAKRDRTVTARPVWRKSSGK